jgi:hypothetical protein
MMRGMFGIDMGYFVWGICFALSGLEAIYSLLNRWAAPIAGLFRPFRAEILKKHKVEYDERYVWD